MGLVFFAIGVDFYKTTKNGIGWVYQAKHGTAIMKFIKEENQCIYFIDVWENEGKICGDYQIKLFN